jgi:hypothetical protein
MRDAFYDFDWTVAPRYDWQDWLDRSGKPVIVPAEGLISLESASAVELAWSQSQEAGEEYGPVLCPVIKDATEVRKYHPMQRNHAALFREFGDLEHTSQASILAFAQKYGALGVQTQRQTIRVRGTDGELRDHHAYGEPYLRWALEICLMREGLRLAGRKRSLRMSQRLKWLFDRHLQHVQGRLGFDQAGEPKLALEPLTLVSAMWLQLALAITGEKRFVACKFCRRMFEISTEQSGFRSHREFCSDSCKTKDYRKRKRSALRLFEGGKLPAEISEKTGTDATTVRTWLKASKSRRNAKTGEA